MRAELDSRALADKKKNYEEKEVCVFVCHQGGGGSVCLYVCVCVRAILRENYEEKEVLVLGDEIDLLRLSVSVSVSPSLPPPLPPSLPPSLPRSMPLILFLSPSSSFSVSPTHHTHHTCVVAMNPNL